MWAICPGEWQVPSWDLIYNWQLWFVKVGLRCLSVTSVIWIRAALAVCCIMWTVSICVLEKFITSFFFHHSTQSMVAMCTNAQLWWFVIFGISSTCGCFVSRFIRALDVGHGFCVVHLILMWWLVIYYLCFCYLWRMAGDVLRKNFWWAKYSICIATWSFSLVFVFCAFSWRWMLLTIGLQFLYCKFD